VPAGRASPKHRNFEKMDEKEFQMPEFSVFSILFRCDAVSGQRVKPNLL
jgi:hypothetical protein